MGGSGNQPFSLSQQFLHRVSKSPFPTNCGNRATKFSNWLQEREKDLMEGGIDLTADLQCGDTFHLFALVSSGQLSISPCLPDEGVGETEDLRSSKRKIDSCESSDDVKSKKLKSFVAAEGEIISRREKGFPGIMLYIQRTAFPTADAVDLFKDQNTCTGEQNVDGNDIFRGSLFDSVLTKHILNSGSYDSVAENSHECTWKVMADYAENLLPTHFLRENYSTINSEVFMSVYAAIQKAGDQGLSMKEVCQVVNMPGMNFSLGFDLCLFMSLLISFQENDVGEMIFSGC